MYMKQVKAHWMKYLRDTRLAQHNASDYFFDMDGGKYYAGCKYFCFFEKTSNAGGFY